MVFRYGFRRWLGIAVRQSRRPGESEVMQLSLDLPLSSRPPAPADVETTRRPCAGDNRACERLRKFSNQRGAATGGFYKHRAVVRAPQTVADEQHSSDEIPDCRYR